MLRRSIVHNYEDPVDLIWIQAAADLGLTIRRSSEAFASYDGKGTLTIAQPSDFDADDCLAQMIFHELCHWLVAGRGGKHLPDWGLSNFDDSDLVFEYAAHRLQAALSAPYGLREFMAVTTDWRPYWEALPDDPLREGDDPAIMYAQKAAHLARLQPFESVLKRSLTATATIAEVVRTMGGPTSLWSITRARHRLGSLLAQDGELKCGSCAWAQETASESKGSETPLMGCLQHKNPGETSPTVALDERACECWEQRFAIEDCGSCGACCHHGFSLLTVAKDDPFQVLHPELVQIRERGEHCVPRPGGVCIALDGDGTTETPYRCRHYATRPENCAEFEVAGDACLLARRRVGLSRQPSPAN